MYDDDYICVACGVTVKGISLRCPYCRSFDTIRPIIDEESEREAYNRYVDDRIDEMRDNGDV